MLGLDQWVQTATRRPVPGGTPSGQRRLVQAFLERVQALSHPRYVGQLIDGLLSDDATFFAHCQALALELAPGGDKQVTLVLNPEEAWVERVMSLASVVEEATLEAHAAEIMGSPSPFQSTLRMRASVTYDQNGPPPEITELIGAYQKVPLALLLMAVLGQRVPAPPADLMTELERVIHQGHLARLQHLASLGYTVPDRLVSADQRLDLEAIYAEHEAWKESMRQEARAFAAQRLAARSKP